MTFKMLFARAAKDRAVGLILLIAFALNPFTSRPVNAVTDGTETRTLRGLVAYNAPDLPSYKELASIDTPSGLTAALRLKLDALLTVPFISNEASLAGAVARVSEDDRLGQFIRVGSWNIERGTSLDLIKIMLEDPEEFKRRVARRVDAAKYNEIAHELEVFRGVDVLVLNEVDFGLKRTEYRDVAREIAAALKMNYVYGVEFLEIDPLNLGTEEFKEIASQDERTALKQMAEVDKERYRGLHGTAILSRFPIKQARLVPFKYQPYDWHGREKKKHSIAEAARRKIGKMTFKEDSLREIRYGGRMMIVAELHVPQLAGESLTIVGTHLEARCKPSERRRQAQEIISFIKDIRGPVVLAGDLNTSGLNLNPTSIGNEIMKRIGSTDFWARRVLKSVASLGPAFDFLFEIANSARTFHDPTARNIFLFGPNKEADLFKDFERMRFADGFAFDFRGDRERTVNGTKGTLANSNHRSVTKGFITTRAAPRTILAVGKYKLDWILVKAYARDPKGKREPYRLAPHFPRTLEKLNYSLGRRLSDHSPLTVDLPLDEPKGLK